MNDFSLSIGGVLLLGIIGVSVYGAKALPAGALVPLHFGGFGYMNWAPKNLALAIWPVVGAGLFVFLAVTAHSHSAGKSPAPPFLLPLALALLLVNHVGALWAARNRGGLAPNR